MDENPDPLNQFFTSKQASDPEILYSTLSIAKTASAEDIRKSYRKLALIYHPDKHSSKSDKEKEEASKEFQKVGFAYAVLSDVTRRKRYDATGRTDENVFTDAEEMGWDAYFESLFERIDRKALDADKLKYQGSQDEIDDLMEAYENTGGSLPSILEHIPHATNDDESRLIKIINGLIDSDRLQSTKKWKSSSTDTKAKAQRSKTAERQAKEAEQSAKELGVWDEFYGSGKKGKRKSEGKEDAASDGGEGGLQALILKRQKERGGMLDALAEKYGKIDEEERERKRVKGKGKKGKAEDAPPPEISDADFEALQAKMFGGKGKKAKA